ncbi:hypothetical protein AbraIFM66950_005274 [Aspergillus brasiliensis]|nr:hypothetical protein AbraIFM66950_005274 [Aspergillus brasiliensis]
MATFIRHRPLLTGALTIVTISGAVAYFTKRRLNKSCPRIAITELPTASVCRHLIETPSETTTPTPFGATKSTLLSSWSGGDKTYWVPSFVAVQAEVPLSRLSQYGRFSHDNDYKKQDAHSLVKNLVAAFLDARATGLETSVLDRDVPPLSFTPSSRLFGRPSKMGAYMLGTWDAERGLNFRPSDLPSDAPKPVTEFCSNEESVRNGGALDTAGAVMYWMFPKALVDGVDRAASYGLPWRLMEGGFQEFIVEKVSDEKARITYVCVECTNLHPGGQQKRDFKMLPWLLYEAHVLYAQILWSKTVRRLR